ncbi:MAG: type 4a pilus biogenesis protein PilO [Candidatus Omnitrophota bacterium]
MSDFLGGISNDKKKLLAISLVAVAIVYIDVNFLLKAQVSANKSMESRAIKLKGDLDALGRDYKRMQEFKRELSVSKNKNYPKAKTIIAEEQLVSLLEAISNAANKNSVQISQIKPVKEAVKNQSSSKFSVLLINIELFSDYHKLGSFINDLEKNEILIAVANMKIIRSPQDYMKQKVSLTLKTYVKK